jgi:hypothetical protein
MDLYQHDSAAMFRFVIRGELCGMAVQNLEQAWHTAMSTANQKELVVDVSGITDADELGLELLSRMRESGARLAAALPPASEGVLRSLGLPVAAPDGRYGRPRVWRLLRLGRPCE